MNLWLTDGWYFPGKISCIMNDVLYTCKYTPYRHTLANLKNGLGSTSKKLISNIAWGSDRSGNWSAKRAYIPSGDRKSGIPHDTDIYYRKTIMR